MKITMEAIGTAESELSRRSRHLLGIDPEFARLLGTTRTSFRQLARITSSVQ